MPNHVTNQLSITSDKQTIDKIKQEIFVDEKFDFNRISPMPEILSSMVSSSDIDEAKFRLGLKNRYSTTNSNIDEFVVEQLINAYKQTGFVYWYDFALENWGTKWNAYEVHITMNNENINVQFETAWSTPEPIIRKFSLLYPHAEFKVAYADEDFGANCGNYVYKDGEIIDDYCPEYGTDEAYDLAAEILGYDAREEDWDE